jgi:RimJ/RimL family protein N-acetyltransferase
LRNPFLIGERLYLRGVEPEDAAAFAAWLSDPDVRRNLMRQRPLTVADEIEYIKRVNASETDLLLGVVLREGDRLIGGLGLHQIDVRNRHACFGISIGDKEQWDRGYGTEATRLLLAHCFEVLNLNRVWLQVYEYNGRGIHVYEKLGFRVEGRLRQHTFRDGRYWDVITMGVLREEWEAAQLSRSGA